MGLSLNPPSPPATPFTSQAAMQSLLSRSRILVNHFEELPDHLHRLCLLHLSDGSRLMLKTSPTPDTALLRTEQTYLDTEATVLELLANTKFPIPHILCRERLPSNIGAPLLLTTCLPGVPFSDLRFHLTRKEQANIESQIRAWRARLGRYSSYTYGPVGLVRAGEGFRTWREAFTSMFESILMDGEDMMVNVPYHCIREAISIWESYLDDVQEARLVLPDMSRWENILVDAQTHQVTGIVDFGQALWGDVNMADAREIGDVKGLLYICYNSVLTIVKNNYRSKADDLELTARMHLTSALRQLVPERR